MFRICHIEKVLLRNSPDVVMAVGDVDSTPECPLRRFSNVDRGSDRNPALWDGKASGRVFAVLSRNAGI